MLFQCCMSEWRKKRRSMASWALVVGAFFTPLIITIARLAHPDRLQAL
jgi:lantibiotic transport system permease protein